MKTKKIITLLTYISIFISSVSFAASYDYIDPGDFYYINHFGDDNEYVVVVRKMGGGEVKVRNINSGATAVVYASELLTKSELESEETTNAVGGVAIGLGLLYCLGNPDAC